jgi:hypothetical protein
VHSTVGMEVVVKEKPWSDHESNFSCPVILLTILAHNYSYIQIKNMFKLKLQFVEHASCFTCAYCFRIIICFGGEGGHALA